MWGGVTLQRDPAEAHHPVGSGGGARLAGSRGSTGPAGFGGGTGLAGFDGAPARWRQGRRDPGTPAVGAAAQHEIQGSQLVVTGGDEDNTGREEVGATRGRERSWEHGGGAGL